MGLLDVFFAAQRRQAGSVRLNFHHSPRYVHQSTRDSAGYRDEPGRPRPPFTPASLDFKYRSANASPCSTRRSVEQRLDMPGVFNRYKFPPCHAGVFEQFHHVLRACNRHEQVLFAVKEEHRRIARFDITGRRRIAIGVRLFGSRAAQPKRLIACCRPASRGNRRVRRPPERLATAHSAHWREHPFREGHCRPAFPKERPDDRRPSSQSRPSDLDRS